MLGMLMATTQVQLQKVDPPQSVVDAFREARLKIFGPTRAAAQLESSKDFAKALTSQLMTDAAGQAELVRQNSVEAFVLTIAQGIESSN